MVDVGKRIEELVKNILAFESITTPDAAAKNVILRQYLKSAIDREIQYELDKKKTKCALGW